MCGIYGEIRYSGSGPVPSSTFDAAAVLSCLAHRGPEASGSVSVEGAAGASGATECSGGAPAWRAHLAHTRLKIIDLSERAAQPMASADGRYQLVFNGEIYNYKSLRAELRGLGRAFRSESDTEVLLAALETWGERALPRLDGIFGFALVDRRDGSLLVGRDAFGVKPIYVATVPGGIAVSSELRCLTRAVGGSPSVDAEGLATYLAFGSVYGPATILSGIRELLPGHSLRVSRDGVEVKRWFTLSTDLRRDPVPHEQAVREVRSLLAGAVERQLVADVPVGIFLSSGMDSTAMLALAARTHAKSVRAVTVAFEGHHDQFNEDRVAADFARSQGVDHETLRLKDDWVLEDLDAIIGSMDQPSMDGVNTWAVSRAVKNAGITVALSGLGGDEVFGGYAHLRSAFELGWAHSGLRTLGPVSRAAGAVAGWLGGSDVKSRKGAAFLRHASSVGGAYAVRRALFLPEESGGLVTDGVASAWARRGIEGALSRSLPSGLPPAQEATVLELENYMSFTLLRDTDCMSMAHALEVRVPMLDRGLVEYVLSLPLELRFGKGRQKPLLAAAVPEIESVAGAPKRGFTLPFERWLAGPMRSTVERRLAELPHAGRWVRPEAALQLFRDFAAGDTRLWTRVWAIYVLDRWMETNVCT